MWGSVWRWGGGEGERHTWRPGLTSSDSHPCAKVEMWLCWDLESLFSCKSKFHGFFFFFFFFLDHTCGIWRFPGWWLNWSCSCQPPPQSQPHQIRATSVTYAAACGNTGSLTHWDLGLNPYLPGYYDGFLTHWATIGTLPLAFVKSQHKNQPQEVKVCFCSCLDNHILLLEFNFSGGKTFLSSEEGAITFV